MKTKIQDFLSRKNGTTITPRIRPSGVSTLSCSTAANGCFGGGGGGLCGR